MARKSRTQPKQSPDTLNVLSKVYKTAIYVRLSAEKDETRDRKTLINQRNLIKNFVDQQMDMEVYDIYMDDEISGTTFDRPEFERMMSDMRAGRINCIVVKDLSRLGRDYIETGNLVERVFPMMNIRFVAITDNYDSSKKDADLMVAVTNIANDLYAKDISKKISASKQEAMEKGIPTGNVAYGYKVVFNENKVKVMVEDKAEYDRISNSTVSCYQSYREGKYTKEEYVQLRKTNQELLADLENQISDLQEKAANQEPDTEEKIEQLTQYSMLEQYNYCTGEERFTFIKLPKCLVEDEGFVELSMDAKLLYALFLDRVSLSIKNGWIDNQGRVFIYYSIKNICEDLNCGTQKACKLLDELEKVGALERKRQGLGRPNKLYLKKMF